MTLQLNYFGITAPINHLCKRQGLTISTRSLVEIIFVPCCNANGLCKILHCWRINQDDNFMAKKRVLSEGWQLARGSGLTRTISTQTRPSSWQPPSPPQCSGHCNQTNARNPDDRQATEKCARHTEAYRDVRDIDIDIDPRNAHGHCHYVWVAAWYRAILVRIFGPSRSCPGLAPGAGDSPGVLGCLWAGRARGRGAGTGPASHSSRLSCPPVTPSQGRTRVTSLKQF